jgi:integrase
LPTSCQRSTSAGRSDPAALADGLLRRLLDVVSDDDVDFFTYRHLAVMTGARRSQLLAMCWADVDVKHAAMGFCRALVEAPTGPVLRPTRNRRTYRVALDPKSAALLAEHRQRARGHIQGDLLDGALRVQH